MTNTRWSFSRRPLKIFISYRREDSVDSAGRLYSDLKSHFNRPFRNFLERKVIVVRDVDTMPGGINYKKHIEEEIKTSAAFITIIGRDWLNFSEPKSEQRRLDDPEDIHRKEIITALSLSIPVFPVLVEGARMPDEKELPDALKGLASQNAKSINDPGWDAKVDSLIKDLELIVTSKSSRLIKIGGIAFLIFLLGAIGVLGINKYRDCCTDNSNASTQTSPTPNTNSASSPVANTSPTTTPATNTSTPTPGVSPANSPVITLPPTPTPSSSPAFTLGGTAWDYERFGNSGKPILGYVISFAPDGTYIFRCVNKDSYSNKCLNEEWIASPLTVHERRWKLDGNTITIFWNKSTKYEMRDVGEIIGGKRIKSLYSEGSFPSESWSATIRN